MKALVTGASSGMGRDMAKYLYSLGYELYLVARNKKDLNREFKGYKNIHTYGYNLIIEEEQPLGNQQIRGFCRILQSLQPAGRAGR